MSRFHAKKPYDTRYGGAPPADYGSRDDDGYGGSSYGSQDPYDSHRSGYDAGYGTSSYATQNSYAPRHGGGDGRFREDPNYEYRQQQHYQDQSGHYGQSGASQRSQEYDSEEDIESIKSSIMATKNGSLSSTQSALNLAMSAETSGLQTLGQPGAQGERLHNTEKNLDVASRQNRLAEERAWELKGLNHSMFVPSVGNPLRSRSRAEDEEARIIARHQREREERHRTREYDSYGRRRM